MADDFDLVLDAGAIDDLGYDDEIVDFALEAGEAVADLAAEGAPKLTGAGAASIHAEQDSDGDSGYVDVGWDASQFHMWFAENGTSRQPATPFLRPALDRAQI